MFEDSLLESTHRLSAGSRWPAIASLALQAALAAVIVSVPLLHPERLALALPTMTLAPPLAPPPPPPQVRVREEMSATAWTQTAAPSAPAMQQVRFNLHPLAVEPEGPPAAVLGTMMAGNSTNPFLTGEGVGAGTRPAVAVATRAPVGRVNVSRGVAAGLLLAPIRPEYPQIARAAHIEGTVVVHALISKSGTIESAATVSGPMMLYGAALDAVRAAQYRPFLLSGEPVEVETTITINFRLGG